MQVYAAVLVALGSTGCTSVAAPEPAPERRVAARDGLELAYEERGEGAPTLVFVHGWCGERGFWRATMEALAGRYRVLALDLAGHGASGAQRTHWTLEALAADVVAVVEAAGAADVILVGHSMGAPVALLAAPALAPRVRGVIAVDSLHDADFAYPAGFLEGVATALEADFPRALEASLRGVLSPTAPDELIRWIVARALRTDRAAAVALLRGFGDFDLAQALGRAGVPVRAINAAPRPGAPHTALERNRTLADFDALLQEGVGHFPMLEAPEDFRALLERVLLELQSNRESTTR